MKRVTLVVTDATAKALVSLCDRGFLKGYAKGTLAAYDLAGFARPNVSVLAGAQFSGRVSRDAATFIQVDGRTYEVPRRRTLYGR